MRFLTFFKPNLLVKPIIIITLSFAPAPSVAEMILKERIANYPEEIAVFSPSDEFASTSEFSTWIIHFHGYRMQRAHLQYRLENFDDVLNEFQFDRLLSQSKRDGLLIVPSSLGRDATFLEYFKSPQVLRSWLWQIAERLQIPLPKKIVLTAHSGGQLPVSRILNWKLSIISEVHLLDATYGDTSVLSRFVESPQNFLSVTYRPESATEQGALKIQSHFRDTQAPKGVLRVNKSYSNHWKLLSDWYADVLKLSKEQF